VKPLKKIKWLQRFQGRNRIRVTTSGKWYLALVIGSGVSALVTGNNIIYLLSSFLLSGLILSGFLSDMSVMSIQLKWIRKDAIATQGTADLIEVYNKSYLPILCLAISEYDGNSFLDERAFIPYIPPRTKFEVKITHPYRDRGLFSWSSLVFSTKYPFGFITKSHWTSDSGERVIWPAPTSTSQSKLDQTGLATAQNASFELQRNQESGASQSLRIKTEVLEGEIRSFREGDSYRDILWKTSLKRAQPYVRNRGKTPDALEIIIDLRGKGTSETERLISEAAMRIYQYSALNPRELSPKRTLVECPVNLIIVDSIGKRQFTGARESLKELSIQKAG